MGMFNIEEELRRIPCKPGVYMMKDEDGDIIYVGKAVILKNRVRQYFNKSLKHSDKVIAMVSHVRSFEYIITDSELEALILECNLIKRYRPKFNVLLKDDKSYPYIKVTVGEDYPRVMVTRKMIKDGSVYYGPYSSSKAVNNVMDIVREYFPTKKCNKKLGKKTRECLNYHIGKCKGPCIGAINRDDYRKMIDGICDFLGGNKNALKRQLKKMMSEEAEALNFEKAAKIRDTIDGLELMGQDQKVLDIHLKDKDVVGFYRSDDDMCVQVFYIREGKVIGRDNYIMSGVRDETDEEVVNAFVCQFYSNQKYIPSNIYVPVEISQKDILQDMLTKIKKGRVNVVRPQRGENVRLVDLVNRNAKQEMERLRGNCSESGLMLLKDIVGLKRDLVRLEAYDVSNMGNENIVVAMVVVTEGRFDKGQYRKFKIKTTKEQNDYQSMQEAIYRRLKRGIGGDVKFSPLPDVILLDGGVGHVHAVDEVVGELGLKIPLVGMVKDDRHRTRGLIVDDKEIDVEEELFRFVTRIQDETHRCALGYNKKLREMAYSRSSLNDISGIGPTKKMELLKYFRGVSNIMEASEEEIAKVPGISIALARRIYEHYRKKKEEEDNK